MKGRMGRWKMEQQVVSESACTSWDNPILWDLVCGCIVIRITTT